jgi:hypothetical protein
MDEDTLRMNMLKWGWNPKIQGNYRAIQIIKILANRLSACGQISAAYAIRVSLIT